MLVPKGFGSDHCRKPGETSPSEIADSSQVLFVELLLTAGGSLRTYRSARKMAEQIALGQKVVILGKRKGTVKFIGHTSFGPGEWVGIELDKATGTHDGGVNGQRYFTCIPGHGVYVQRQGVLPSNSWQVRAQSAARCRETLPHFSRDPPWATIPLTWCGEQSVRAVHGWDGVCM